MESNLKYDKHIFICTNQRVNSERPSCGEEHGIELVKAFKKEIKDRGLNVNMRAQKAGCMDTCELGPSVVVYPEGVFYGHVTLADVMEIVEEHLINDRPVERLRLKFQRPN
jgi:(2Fe-2S) ferredoxin